MAPAPVLTLFFYHTIVAYVLRSTVRRLFGRTPKGQTLLQGYTIQALRLVMSSKVTNIRQSRILMNVSTSIVHLHTGTFTQKSKDRWATKVDGKGWTGYWIPFQDQVNKTKPVVQRKLTAADIGAGCDIVMFAIH
ncbi:hypothetical protein BGZ94_005504, partial [Podila epigama]